MIAITALIGTEISEIPLMIFSAVFITLPQLVVAVLNENRYGGADIKIMAACAFLLGLDCGFVAVILGLTVALSTTFIITKKQKKDFKESFPVVPYLALGSFLAYMI